MECELLDTCGFFKRYEGCDNLGCKGFIKLYCKGPRQAECKRKQYRLERGEPPPDNMLPTGQLTPARPAPRRDTVY